MSKIERLQKYLIVGILLFSLIAAAGILLLVQSLDGSLGDSGDTGADSGQMEEAEASGSEELTEVVWHYPDHIRLGETLGDEVFENPDGSQTRLSEHLGVGTTFVMYWGSWCSYCEKQMEVLQPLAEMLEEEGIKVVLVDKMDPEKESLEQAQKAIAEKKIPFEWVVDADLSVYQKLGMHIIPTSFFLDSEGKLVYCYAGVIDSVGKLDAMLSYVQNGAAADTEAFVRNNLMNAEGGVQMQAAGQGGNAPKGADVLAESQGLLMEYAIKQKEDVLFDAAYGYVKNHLDENGLLRWYGTEKKGQEAQVNALLDDLRVLRALEDKNVRDGGLDAEILRRAEAIARDNIDEHGNLVDFYTFSDGTKAHTLTMCYVDRKSLEVLETYVPEGAEAIQEAQETLENAYLGDEFPFYASAYDYETQKYSETSLNMAEAMMTLLHQAEVGRLPEASLHWLREQMKGNGVWARYDIHGNVTAEGYYQSPAVYAIVGLIAVECQDSELLTQAVSRMESFRCFSQGDPLNGAFSETIEGVSSFDPCMALVLYAAMKD